MAATKFHINDAGEVGACKASIKACKFGSNGESTGTGVDGHYSSKEEAVAASEKFMETKYKEVYKGYRRGESEGMGLEQPMKKRLIKEAQSGSVHVFPASIGRVLSKDKDELIRKTVAETLSSQKLLRDMSDDESARVRKAVALRTNNREVLAKLALDSDKSVSLAAIQNAKTPTKARKAGQSAIREANIRNLAKARATPPAAYSRVGQQIYDPFPGDPGYEDYLSEITPESLEEEGKYHSRISRTAPTGSFGDHQRRRARKGLALVAAERRRREELAN